MDMSSCRLLRRSRIPGRTVAVSTRVWGGFAWRFQYGQAGLPATSFSGHAVLYGTGTQACAYLEARGQRFSICWLPLQKPELGLAEAGGWSSAEAPACAAGSQVTGARAASWVHVAGSRAGTPAQALPCGAQAAIPIHGTDARPRAEVSAVG